MFGLLAAIVDFGR